LLEAAIDAAPLLEQWRQLRNLKDKGLTLPIFSGRERGFVAETCRARITSRSGGLEDNPR
jgi:hypothetical protein